MCRAVSVTLADDCPKQRGSLWGRQRSSEGGKKVDVQGSRRIHHFAYLCSLGHRAKVCGMIIAQYSVPCCFEECFEWTAIEGFPESRLINCFMARFLFDSWVINSVMQRILTHACKGGQTALNFKCSMGRHDWTEMLGWVGNYMRWELRSNKWGLTIESSGWGAVGVWSDIWLGGGEWRSHVQLVPAAKSHIVRVQCISLSSDTVGHSSAS